jgi:subtilisin family serine protease
VDEGVDIINLGIGGEFSSGLLSDAISYAVKNRVLVVAPAGNDGPYQGSLDHPAHSSSVLNVGGMDLNFVISEWSSHGSNKLTEKGIINDGDLQFAAPGVNIESVWRDGGYAILSGSSMAGAHVSGLAAKLWQKESLDPVSAVRALLKKMSVDIESPGEDESSGFGFPRL